MSRSVLPILLATLGLTLSAAEPLPLAPIAPGPFAAALDSFKQYQYPEWFRDAKFGIWAHWGPQAVPRYGDWYARFMYVQDGLPDWYKAKGRDAYAFHLEHYGHPSVFGYKDLIPLWKAERWNPQQLMALYKKTGARYFVSIAAHHDNFALWNSPLHRWNSVNMGPKKDVVGLWQQAAKDQGLRFGVSEHLAGSFNWLQVAHGSDKTGAQKGVPYDGNDTANQDLYHRKGQSGDGYLSKDLVWRHEWHARIRELIDSYHPDLLYSDSVFPFEEIGAQLVAHLYNRSIPSGGSQPEAVYTCKQASEGRWVRDIERGVADAISPDPWQTDTSIGDWFYCTGQKYKPAGEVIRMLADIVSKNGNLLINVVQTPEGDLEPDMLAILDQIGSWMAINGEAIYATRPWQVFGERPSDAPEVKGGNFNEGKIAYTAKDIRFTTSKDGKTLYVIALGWPENGQLVIRSLARGSALVPGELGAIRLLGSTAEIAAQRDGQALTITMPATRPCEHAYVLALGICQ